MSEEQNYTPPTQESLMQESKDEMARILSNLNNVMPAVSNTPTTNSNTVLTESSETVQQPSPNNSLVLGGVCIFKHSNDEIFSMVESYILENGMDEYICSVMSQTFSLDHVLSERKISQKNFQYYKSIGEGDLMAGERSRFNRLNKRAKELTENIARLGKQL